MRRRLVFEHTALEELKRRLSHVSVSHGGWSTTLRDSDTGDEWMETRLDGGHHGGGWPYLVRLPHPRPGELVELAVSSPFADEAELAARLISDHIGARRQLLRRLQEEADRADHSMWARIRQVLEWAHLENSANLLPTIGKHVSEIQEDHERFEELAREAGKLRLRAVAELG